MSNHGVQLSDLNWIAIGVALVWNVALGFLWYAPKVPTGRIWMRGLGRGTDWKPDPKAMAVSMSLMLVTTFLFVFVIAHDFIAYRDAYRLDQAGYDLTVADGLMGGFFTWLGIVMPVQISQRIFEGRPWSFFLVNTAYYLVALLGIGLIYVLV